jgi:hypothetical protein
MKTILVLLITLQAAGQEYKRHWILPDFGLVQYAGSIGMISSGFGYSFFNDRSEIGLIAGFTPTSFRSTLYNLTVKANYKPFNLPLSKRLSSHILYGGMYASRTFGNEYWSSLPDYYPEGYYYWSPGLRYGIYLGTNLSGNFGSDIKTASLFFECSTYDLLLYSYWPNRNAIPLHDILRLALGVRIGF